MKLWKDLKDSIIYSERFAELAMTGSMNDGVGAVMSAIDQVNEQLREENRVYYSQSEIVQAVKEIRTPVDIPVSSGEQLNLF